MTAIADVLSGRVTAARQNPIAELLRAVTTDMASTEALLATALGDAERSPAMRDLEAHLFAMKADMATVMQRVVAGE